MPSFFFVTLLMTFLVKPAWANGDVYFGSVGLGTSGKQPYFRLTLQEVNIGGEVEPRLAVRAFSYDWKPGTQHQSDHWFSLAGIGVAMPVGPVTASVVWDIFTIATAANWAPKTSFQLAVSPDKYEGQTGTVSVYMRGLHEEFGGPTSERIWGLELSIVGLYVADGIIL